MNNLHNKILYGNQTTYKLSITWGYIEIPFSLFFAYESVLILTSIDPLSDLLHNIRHSKSSILIYIV